MENIIYMYYGIKTFELKKNKDDYYFFYENKKYCFKRIIEIEEMKIIISSLIVNKIKINALKNKKGSYITYINDKCYILSKEAIKEDNNIIIIGQKKENIEVNLPKINYFKKENIINNFFKLYDEYSMYLLLKGLDIDLPVRISINHEKYNTIFYESLINYKIGYFVSEIANNIKNEILTEKNKNFDLESINKKYNLNRKEIYIFYSNLFMLSKEEKEKITNYSDLNMIYKIMCEFRKKIHDEIKTLN